MSICVAIKMIKNRRGKISATKATKPGLDRPVFRSEHTGAPRHLQREFKMPRIFTSMIALTLLSASLFGCSTSYELNADEYLRRGDCNSAVREYENSTMWMGERAYRIAAIYGGCAKDRANAIKWATLSARYDEQRARDYLVKLGAPIPSPDLYRNGTGSSNAVADGIKAFGDGLSESMKTTKCTSRVWAGSIETTCR